MLFSTESLQPGLVPGPSGYTSNISVCSSLAPWNNGLKDGEKGAFHVRLKQLEYTDSKPRWGAVEGGGKNPRNRKAPPAW